MIKVGIVGCGKMHEAIVAGAYATSLFEFVFYGPRVESPKKFSEKFGGSYTTNLEDLKLCNVISIGCKPQQFKALSEKLKPIISKETLILSIMAGIDTNRLMKDLGHEKVTRLMPNTPLAINKGIVVSYFTKACFEIDKETVKNLFSKSGKLFIFDDEKQIDLTTPFSGSGPAYVFELLRIFTNKQVELGIPKEVAKELIIDTFIGATEYAKKSRIDLEELRNNVTSKAGVTYEALESFKKDNLEQTISKAMDKALKRNEELSN